MRVSLCPGDGVREHQPIAEELTGGERGLSAAAVPAIGVRRDCDALMACFAGMLGARGHDNIEVWSEMRADGIARGGSFFGLLA